MGGLCKLDELFTQMLCLSGSIRVFPFLSIDSSANLLDMHHSRSYYSAERVCGDLQDSCSALHYSQDVRRTSNTTRDLHLTRKHPSGNSCKPPALKTPASHPLPERETWREGSERVARDLHYKARWQQRSYNALCLYSEQIRLRGRRVRRLSSPSLLGGLREACRIVWMLFILVSTASDI